MKNITDALMNNKERINNFLSQLDSERRYFDITIERIMSWKLVMIEEADNKINAIVALEKKFGMTRSAIILKRELQGKGLGKILLEQLIDEARKKHHIVWAIISEKNMASIKLHLAKDFRFIGNRQNLFYLAAPLDFVGHILFHSFAKLFPLTKIFDKIRH